MISIAGLPSASAASRSSESPFAFPVDDAALQSFADRQREQLRGTLSPGVGCCHTFEELEEALQRVVAQARCRWPARRRS